VLIVILSPYLSTFVNIVSGDLFLLDVSAAFWLSNTTENIANNSKNLN
jgi:hypothetical protein